MEAAIREQQIAVSMMRSNDYMGARDKLMKARNHFPGLKNVTAMITVCDILCASVFGVPGCEIDWYWILQTNKAADVSQIEFKYESLINLLSPIKNMFPGTESALKLINNAHSVLTDKKRRSEFDAKRAASWGPKGVVELRGSPNPEFMNKGREVTSQSSSGFMSKGREATSLSSSGSKWIGSECSDRSNGACNSVERPLKTAKYSSDDDVEVTAEVLVIDKMSGKNYTHGVERIVDSSTRIAPLSIKPLAFSKPDQDFYDFGKNRKAEVFAGGQIWAAYDQEKMPRKYALINSVHHHSPFQLSVTWLKPAPLNAHERRWNEVGLPVSCGYFKLDRFQMDRTNLVVGGQPVFSHLISLEVTPVQLTMNQPVELYPQQGEVWALYSDWQPFKWCSDPGTRKGCGFHIVEILKGYSKDLGVRVSRLVKVAGFKSIFRRYNNEKGSELPYDISAANLFMFSHSIPTFRFKGGEKELVSNGMLELDPLSVPEDIVVETVGVESPLAGGRSGDDSSCKHLSSISPPITSVPKARSSESKWSQSDFASGQIWAIYDGPDSMPRRYAIVNNIVSGNEVSVTFLEPHPEIEDEIHWVEKGLSSVCGIYRTGNTKFNLGMSRFSHLVKLKDNTNTYIHRIYPQKGEIWAMYKNWNSKWKLSDSSSCQYRVVEIISDFSENSEIRVASLVEVPGHKTFYQKQLFDGFELVRAISPKEMLSFSHQIPAFIVPRIKSHGIPDGSWHLEPDALPPLLPN